MQDSYVGYPISSLLEDVHLNNPVTRSLDGSTVQLCADPFYLKKKKKPDLVIYRQ